MKSIVLMLLLKVLRCRCLRDEPGVHDDRGALLQSHRMLSPSPLEAAHDVATMSHRRRRRRRRRLCAADGADPYASGSKVDCCSGLTETLGPFNSNKLWSYKCLCTQEGEDPTQKNPLPDLVAGNESWVPCCGDLTHLLRDWDSNAATDLTYRCTSPTQLSVSADCTHADQDPWVSGVEKPCCDSLEEELKQWDKGTAAAKPDRWYYQCKQATVGSQRGDSTASFGKISELYTFGAPPTTELTFVNAESSDGCFQGLRVYTENGRRRRMIVGDAAALFWADKNRHANVAALALHNSQSSKSDDQASHFRACNNEPPTPNEKQTWPDFISWPRHGWSDWSLHSSSVYIPRLQTLKVSNSNVGPDAYPFNVANQFAQFAWMPYDAPNVTAIKAKLSANAPEWRLVGMEVASFKQTGSGMFRTTGAYKDYDAVVLLQHASTKECVIAFEGTDAKPWELGTSLDSAGGDFCGMKQVHRGFRNEIRRIFKQVGSALQTKLAKCSSVKATGHSLGGAIAEVFSACVNSKHVGNADYHLFQWTPAAAAMNDEIGNSYSVG